MLKINGNFCFLFLQSFWLWFYLFFFRFVSFCIDIYPKSSFFLTLSCSFSFSLSFSFCLSFSFLFLLYLFLLLPALSSFWALFSLSLGPTLSIALSALSVSALLFSSLPLSLFLSHKFNSTSLSSNMIDWKHKKRKNTTIVQTVNFIFFFFSMNFISKSFMTK